ncbi:MAG: rod-binding protein [Armatimonadota bacterium]
MRVETTNGIAHNEPADKQNIALKKACGEFEALLVGQLLKSMRNTVQESDLFGSREKESIFREMLDDEIAREACRSDTLGLAKLLYAQLSQGPARGRGPESAEK